MRILLIEDEPAIADTLVYALRTEGFHPEWRTTGGEGLAAIQSSDVALVILDIGLPDGSGLEWCKRIRTLSSVPILFLTARADELDRVLGLELGADDYVTKPFSPREVTARVKAILRRARPTPGTAPGAMPPPWSTPPANSPSVATPAVAGDAALPLIPLRPGAERREGATGFVLDEERCEIRYGGTRLELTRYEYRLLRTLLGRPGKVFSRDELMTQAWEDPGASLDRTVDAHIKMLRAKLRGITPQGEPIQTHRGLGYSLRGAMTIRTRILLVYLLIVGGGFYYLVNRSVAELRPRYLESMEESLVDTVNLLATVIERDVGDGPIDAFKVNQLFRSAFARRFYARIFSLTKDRVDLRVYVTDERGIVLYDSIFPSDEGQDYSQRMDVARTLKGKYGARATRTEPDIVESVVLYVAAPVRSVSTDRILGVVSIGKPTASINDLVNAARRRVMLAGLAGGGLIILVGVVFSIWIATPVARLTAYARAVRDGRPAELPRLAGREVGELRQAFEEMRAALEGKAYVERYVQTLTHEIKSPLSAIRGAAEILVENPPDEVRVRFIENIRAEAGRIQRVVDLLLQLASLEARKARPDFKAVDLAQVAREVVDASQPAAQVGRVALTLDTSAPTACRGDAALLAQAVSNLVQNALAFTPAGGAVVVRTSSSLDGGARITVDDSGTGIPEYAQARIFERFYSLPRPGSGVKSTGLGLSLVREITKLHEGEISVTNRAEGGVRAEMRIPISRAPV